MAPVFKGYLRLCRPPNLPTAAADILAGAAIVGFFNAPNSFWYAMALVLSSICMYAGGVVLNDVFDVALDTIERPERPIPSGLISLSKARAFGFSLLFLGIVPALMVSVTSAGIAVVLAVAIVYYNVLGKNNSFFGPLGMGVCRGLNLFLGMSILQEFSSWAYTSIPLLFIFAVTLVSRGEVHGNNKRNILLAGLLYGLVILAVMVLHGYYNVGQYRYLPFLGLFALMVSKPLFKAYGRNTPKNIMKAVKAGVLSIIVLDAAMAVANSNWLVGMGIVMLLPLSLLLAKAFAVT